MNLINWREEWHILSQTIKQQDFEHVLEKANRDDLLNTVKSVIISTLATGIGALIGGLIYGPLGALAGSTTASMIAYGVSNKYKPLYELIRQLSSEESHKLLINIRAILGGVLNEQTIILSAVGDLLVAIAKEIYKLVNETKKKVNIVIQTNQQQIISLQSTTTSMTKKYSKATVH